LCAKRNKLLALPLGEIGGGGEDAWLFFDGPTRDEWLVARSRRKAGPLPGNRLRVLSETGSTVEAAAKLFAALHELDGSGARRILAQRAPTAGLGEAINDRLFRAGQ
jgi:hypothetical protein